MDEVERCPVYGIIAERRREGHGIIHVGTLYEEVGFEPCSKGRCFVDRERYKDVNIASRAGFTVG
jgi:hypothetical protein